MDIRPSLQRLEWHLWNQWRERAQHNDHLELTNSELQYVYILLAWSETGLRLTELAELMQVSKASASSMISKLEKRGYLSRKPCSEDARAQRLLPTTKAMTLKQEEPRVYQAAVRHFEQALSAEELQQLTVLLDKACRDLDLGDLYPPQLFQSPYNI